MTQKDNEVIITEAESADIPEIVRLEEKYIPGGWSYEGFADWIKGERNIMFKAVKNGELTGFVNGSFVLDEGELLNIAVEEELRGQGTAERLLAALCKVLKEKGVSVIFLEVRENNGRAQGFYRKSGFEKIGIRRNYYHDPEDNAVIMKKQLEGE